MLKSYGGCYYDLHAADERSRRQNRVCLSRYTIQYCTYCAVDSTFRWMSDVKYLIKRTSRESLAGNRNVRFPAAGIPFLSLLNRRVHSPGAWRHLVERDQLILYVALRIRAWIVHNLLNVISSQIRYQSAIGVRNHRYVFFCVEW